MSKLSAQDHAKLRTAFASGKVPEYGEPGYNDFFDLFGELTVAVGGEWENPKSSSSRREVAALVDFWSAICTEGLLLGVAVNQPDLLAAAKEVAASMNLSACMSVFDRVQKCIPPEVQAITEVDARLRWYEAKKNAKFGRTLETLEEEASEGEFGTELLEACMRRILAKPAEFFHEK